MVRLTRDSFGDVELGEGKGFAVNNILPKDEADATGESFQASAEAVRIVVLESWLHKFVPRDLSEAAVRDKIGSQDDQRDRINRSADDNSRYWVAYRPDDLFNPQITSAGQAQAVLRVQHYKPRNPLKKPYPNVTDLETINGRLTGEYENQAAALLYFGLTDFRSAKDSKTSAYSELPNKDGIGFYENLGYRRTGNQPTEEIGGTVFTYVHLEAASLADVIRTIRSQYPWL